MLPNSAMHEARFLAWHRHRQFCRRILAHLDAGRRVVVGSSVKATVYDARHRDMFRATPKGVELAYHHRKAKRWQRFVAYSPHFDEMTCQGLGIRFCD